MLEIKIRFDEETKKARAMIMQGNDYKGEMPLDMVLAICTDELYRLVNAMMKEDLRG